MTSTRPGFRSGGILRISARISESRVYDAAVFVPALASQARYRVSTSRLRNSDRSRKRAGENSAKGLVVGGAGEGGGRERRGFSRGPIRLQRRSLKATSRGVKPPPR